jgi:hypothetical protein
MGKERPEANVKPATMVLQFDAINTDEGTAELKSGFGKYDIVVRYAGGYLHFIQSFLDGPLYTTTVLEKKTAGGKLKACIPGTNIRTSHCRIHFNAGAVLRRM